MKPEVFSSFSPNKSNTWCFKETFWGLHSESYLKEVDNSHKYSGDIFYNDNLKLDATYYQ